jgi:hypothetical protein
MKHERASLREALEDCATLMHAFRKGLVTSDEVDVYLRMMAEYFGFRCDDWRAVTVIKEKKMYPLPER